MSTHSKRWESKYDTIIKLVCKYKGINLDELELILKDKEYKYLFFVLLNKYGCIDYERLNRDFKKLNKRNINYASKKAMEKFLINREFRELCFDAEEDMNIKNVEK